MRIIKKGKFTEKRYVCDACNCEFEVEPEDVKKLYYYETLRKLYVKCPECGKDIIIWDSEEWI